MSELGTALKSTATVEAISSVLHSWLLKEIGSSMFSHNAVLDDWEQHQADLEKPFEARDNTNTEKAKGHYNRMNEWLAQADEFPDLVSNDKFLARQMFGAQMYTSGAFRKQCFLQAGDASGYLKRRTDDGPTGIDINTVVAETIEDAPPAIQWQQLRSATVLTNETGLTTSKQIHEISSRDSGKEQSDAVDLLTAT